MNYGDHNYIASRTRRARRVEPVELNVSSQSSSSCRACRARRVERVELCCSTSSTQPKCIGSTRRTCRVESSQVEFGLNPWS